MLSDPRTLFVEEGGPLNFCYFHNSQAEQLNFIFHDEDQEEYKSRYADLDGRGAGTGGGLGEGAQNPFSQIRSQLIARQSCKTWQSSSLALLMGAANLPVVVAWPPWR